MIIDLNWLIGLCLACGMHIQCCRYWLEYQDAYNVMATLLCKIKYNLLSQQWQLKMQTYHYDYKQYGVGIYDVNSMLQER